MGAPEPAALAMRTPPLNIEAEKFLLGTILVNNRAYEMMSEFLRPEHFALTHNGRIFEAAAALIERGQVADPITLKRYFEQDETLAEIGGPAYLSELANSATTVISAVQYAELVADLYGRRMLIETGEDLVAKAYDSDVEVTAADILREITEGLDQMAAGMPDLLQPMPKIADADCAQWVGVDPVPIKFIIEDFVPEGMTTLLVAEGGAGKSLLMQTAMTCIPTGLPFLGKATAGGKVAGVFAEDAAPVLHHRQNRINSVLNVDMEGLVGRAFPQSFSGHTATLWADNAPTAFFRALERQLAGIENLRLLIIDNTALVYVGNENDRLEVTAFVNALNGLAQRRQIGIILSTHVSKSADGTVLRAASGSTAWVNATRSVLELKAGDNDTATLKLLKANHTKPGEEIPLFWKDGVLLAEDKELGIFATIKRRTAEQVFMDCLDAATKQGRYVTESSNSPRFAPRVFSSMPESGGTKKRDLDTAMNALFSAGKIRVDTIKGLDRHPQKAIVKIEAAGSAGSPPLSD